VNGAGWKKEGRDVGVSSWQGLQKSLTGVGGGVWQKGNLGGGGVREIAMVGGQQIGLFKKKQ